MSDRDTMSKSEIILTRIWWIFVGWISYKNTLFRCLGHHSLKVSRFILLGLVIGCSVLGIMMQIKRQRNNFSAIMDLSACFGLYTVLAYYPIKTRLIVTILLVCLALSVLLSILILGRKVRRRKKYKRILKTRILNAGRATKTIFCLGSASLMAVLIINLVFSSVIVSPTISPINSVKQSNTSVQSVENMEDLILLKKEKWEGLSVEKRINVLQVVANNEQCSLGLSHELNVGADNLDQRLAGYYDDASHQIVVNLDELMYSSSFEMVDTICHEAYHAAQYRMCDAYDEASDDVKSLILYNDASIYKKEFLTYKDGSDGFCEYYSQKVETDARRYAREASIGYFSRINEYLKKTISSREKGEGAVSND